MTVLADEIRDSLVEALKPLELSVINKSGEHTGHTGDDGSGETHFHVRIVSEKFSALSRIQRHQMVNDLLKHKFESSSLHALSIEAIAPPVENR